MVAVIGVVLIAGDPGPDDGRSRAAASAPRVASRSSSAEPAASVTVPPEAYVGLSAVLFFIGVVGVIARRNPLIMLMSIELLFNAANLALVAYARAWGNNAGHIFAFLVITVAAAEAAIGLAIVAVTFRRTRYVDIDEASALRG